MLYFRGPSVHEQTVAWFDRSGSRTLIQESHFVPGGAGGPVLSPDNSRFAVSVSEPDGQNIWVHALDESGTISRLTTDGSSNRRPVWSSDGRQVMFVATADSGGQIVRSMPADGSGPSTPVLALTGLRGIQDALWSHDGDWVVFRSRGRGRGIFAIRPGVDSLPSVSIDTEFNELSPALSRDGRLIAYVSDQSGRFEVYVRPFPDTQAWRVQVSSGGGVEPVWSHTGEELFYKSPSQRALIAAAITDGEPVAVQMRTKLFSLPSNARYFGYHSLYDVSRDDRRFLMFESESGNAGDLIWVDNFHEELKTKLGRNE